MGPVRYGQVDIRIITSLNNQFLCKNNQPLNPLPLGEPGPTLGTVVKN